MTGTPPSPSAKALAYAEDKLGVNSTYETVLEKRNELDAALSELSSKRDEKRALEARLSDVETEVSIQERVKHTDMSEARMTQHLKQTLFLTPEVRELKSKLLALHGDIEGIEYDVRILEFDIKIGVSRLQELGGYLQYLASVKEANTAMRSERVNK